MSDVERVRVAWRDPGPRPDIHRFATAEVRRLMPTLAAALDALDEPEFDLPLHRTEAGYPRCATCDGGGCFDCTDPA